MNHIAVSPTRCRAVSTRHQELRRWRVDRRTGALRRIAARARTLRWSRDLLSVVLEELQSDEALVTLVGPLARIPRSRYPQVIAVAVALRHSWRPDDLARITRRLRLSGPRRRARRASRRD